MAELSEKAREGKRRRRERYRAKKRAEAQAESEAWYLRQLGPDHDWQPSDERDFGLTLEGIAPGVASCSPCRGRRTCSDVRRGAVEMFLKAETRTAIVTNNGVVDSQAITLRCQ
jgi:hypothetical protein